MKLFMTPPLPHHIYIGQAVRYNPSMPINAKFAESDKSYDTPKCRKF